MSKQIQSSGIMTLLIVLAGGTAWGLTIRGGGGGGDTQVIHACINPAGQLRVVGPDELCHRQETPLSWNVVGEQGPPGEPGLTPEQEEILSHMSIVFLDDGMGNMIKTIRITGVNVQVVNGMDDTETTNGAGNLIIGYNEASEVEDRSGSHNLVVGIDHTFNSYGGFVAGRINNITAPYASVSGGFNSTASGQDSSVSGGFSNTASGGQSSVSGGFNNTASGQASSVSGGFNNTPSGQRSSVSGGINNTASGQFSSVSGGAFNTASGFLSSVSGGLNRSAPGDHDWAAGSLFEDE